VTLISHLDHPTLPRLAVSADKSKLAQIIRNLVSNALKFTPAGGTVDVVVEVEVVQEEVLKPLPHPRQTRNQSSQQPASISKQAATYYKLQINVIDTGVGVSKVR